MHVASLELCKELYGLSGGNPLHVTKGGWINTPMWYAVQQEDGRTRAVYPEVHEVYLSPTDYNYVCPAYDLGYLLRKLPDGVNVSKYEGEYWADIQSDYEAHEKADTPEDAACKLAIELIKQGVLKP